MSCLVAIAWASTAVAGGTEPISLNRATAAELSALDGVDAAVATRIVAFREQRGALHSPEELRSIPGLDASTLDAVRRGTSVELELPAGPAETFSSADEVLSKFSSEPSVQDVQEWTSQYANTHPEMVSHLMRDARSFAGLPKVHAEYRTKIGWGNGYTYADVGGELRPELDDADRDVDHTVTARLQWDLSELVMSSDRIRVVNETQDIVKLREKLLTEVTRLYFDRRRQQVQMLLNPARDIEGQVEDQLRLMELTAGVDALTGGQFSGSLRR